MVERQNKLKQEMIQYMDKGHTWIELCNHFSSQPETIELLPAVHLAMIKILASIKYINTVVDPE